MRPMMIPPAPCKRAKQTHDLINRCEGTKRGSSGGGPPPRGRLRSHQSGCDGEDGVEALQYRGDEQELAHTRVHGEVSEVVAQRGEDRRVLRDYDGLRRREGGGGRGGGG